MAKLQLQMMKSYSHKRKTETLNEGIRTDDNRTDSEDNHMNEANWV